MTFEVSTDDIRKVYFGANAFPEEDISAIEYLRDLVLDKARRLVSSDGRDLDDEIADGTLSEIAVKNVVASVVKRTYEQATNESEFDSFSQMSQSAGPYSVNVSPVRKEYNIYFRKDEKRELGLGSRRWSVALPY